MRIFICVILLIGISTFVYGVLIEPFRMIKTEYIVRTPQWPNAYEQGKGTLRIALIADIHAGWPWMTPLRISKIVETVNQEKPDIILLLGDYVATHRFKVPVRSQDVVSELEKLFAPCGVYGIFGNHDFDPRAPGWDHAFRQSKIRMLEDDVVNVTCHGNRFSLVGMKDQWKQNPNLKDIVLDPRFPSIFMIHEPDLFPDIGPNVALTVAGHTHGGQINIPFYGSVFVPSKFGTRYAYGKIEEYGKNMIVSGGLGMSIIPIRFWAPPEVTYVMLGSGYDP